MAFVTAKCGCQISAEIVGGCYGFHGEDDYCECDSPYLEDAEILVPCDEHENKGP